MLYKAFVCSDCDCSIDFLLEVIQYERRYRGKCLGCGRVSTVYINDATPISISKEVDKFIKALI